MRSKLMANSDTSEHWTCSNPDCNQSNPQPISEFLFRPAKGSRYKQCSSCRKAKLKVGRERNKEANAAYQRAYWLKVKSPEDPEQAEKRRENLEKARRRERERYTENKDQERARKRLEYARNPEKFKERSRRQRKKSE